MKRKLFGFLAIILASVISLSTVAAQRNRTVNEKEAKTIVAQIRVKLDDFKLNLQDELQRRRVSTRRILQSFEDLQYEVDNFQEKLLKRRDSQYDVSNLILKAEKFESEFNGLRPSFRLQRDWDGIKDSFDSLAKLYGVSWGNQGSSQSFQVVLTGTYSLDASRSDDVRQVAERAVAQSDIADKEAAEADLQVQLAPPQRLAIEVKGNTVRLASSFAPQLQVIADGQERLQTLSDGRMIKIRATLFGNELSLYSTTDDSDYRVTFSSIAGGRQIRVIRSVNVNYLDQEVSAESYYFKTDSVARFDVYDGSSPNVVIAGSSKNRSFIVPNGIVLTGTLENDVSTKTSKNYDRFSMTIVSPTKFRGAVVEGYLTNVSRSGRISGRSQITFNFDTIRMPNGETYAFRGIVMSVTDTEGKTIKVDTEGTTKGDNQTKEAVKRGSIGAALGAIVGAIAGGAKGAAIGAIIGASAGAGSVAVQGKDDLELKAGSTIMVQASAADRR